MDRFEPTSQQMQHLEQCIAALERLTAAMAAFLIGATIVWVAIRCFG